MTIWQRIHRLLTPPRPVITSEAQKRHIEAQQREVRARLHLLRLESDVVTRRIRENT